MKLWLLSLSLVFLSVLCPAQDLGRHIKKSGVLVQQKLTDTEALESLETLSGVRGLDVDSQLNLIMDAVTENKLGFDAQVLDLIMGTEEKEGVYGFVTRGDRSVTKMAFVIMIGGAISSSSTRLTAYYARTINQAYYDIGMTEGFVCSDLAELNTVKKGFLEKINDMCFRIFSIMPQHQRTYVNKPYSPLKF